MLWQVNAVLCNRGFSFMIQMTAAFFSCLFLDLISCLFSLLIQNSKRFIYKLTLSASVSAVKSTQSHKMFYYLNHIEEKHWNNFWVLCEHWNNLSYQLAENKNYWGNDRN